MNTFNKLIGAAFLAISLNTFASDCPALSGSYNVGTEDNSDFPTVADAVNALKCGGVSGPVHFLLETGTYNERITLSPVQGASSTNHITFESKSGNNSDAVISYGSSDATVVLNGVSHVSFEKLSITHSAAAYGNCVRVDGKSDDIYFKGVLFDGVEVARSGSNSATVYFTSTAPKTNIDFEDCEINNGSVGIVKGGPSPEAPDTKTSITGTLFTNQYETGLALTNEDGPVITNNVITTLSKSSDFKAISLDNVSGSLVISNNIINAANGSIGLALNNCIAPPTSLGQINNNSIAVGGSSPTYGIYLTGTTDNQVLNFNRLKLTLPGGGKQAANQAFYKNSGSGNNVNLMNNIFYDLATGGYTILGNSYKDFFNQLPAQSNPTLSVSANGIMIEKVSPIK